MKLEFISKIQNIRFFLESRGGISQLKVPKCKSIFQKSFE